MIETLLVCTAAGVLGGLGFAAVTWWIEKKARKFTPED